MVWRVKLVAELRAGEPTEGDLACFERDEQAGLDREAATLAPELAYVTARYAALAPFGKVAALCRSCF